MKSQITSTKLQINLKFQYSMTKTCTVAETHRKTDLRVKKLLDTTVKRTIVWNFGFGLLGFV
jgi:hypothetical protein